MDLIEIQQQEVDDSPRYFPAHNSDGLEFLGCALAGEVGEICNEIKKWSRGDFDFVELAGRLRNELPDALIYLVMLAGAMKINLNTAYAEKKEYNEQRFGTDSS